MDSESPQAHLHLKLLEPARERELVYHYTAANGLLGIAASNAIWATDIRLLNDAGEFVYALELTADQLLKHKDRIIEVGAQPLYDQWCHLTRVARKARIFVASFCEDGDLLSQWRAYGAVSGYAVGFNVLQLMRVAAAQPDPATVVKCIYRRDEQTSFIGYAITFLLEEFAKTLNAGDVPRDVCIDTYGRHFIGAMLPIAATFKHPSFQEENEWRFVVRGRGPGLMKLPIEFRPVKRAIVPYVKVPFESVSKTELLGDLVVGPNPHPEQARLTASEMLTQYGFRHELGRSSEIPYRDW